RGIGILVMGLTGAGKSTFISQITQQNIEIGHSLESCTSTVYGYRYFHTNGQEIWLIDTPGFDDTNKANVQILGDIATFLSIFCSEHRLIIGGMFYIHRITDVRMSNSSIKSLRIFEALCGSACFKDVTIITTMWDLLQTPDALQAAERREAALKSRDNFLGRLITGGAQYARHKDARSSSIEVIESVVNQQRKVVLALQEELQRDSATTLVDTTVGKYLEGDLRDMRKKYETKIAQLEAYNDTLVDNDDDMRA
ncbi:P-loop containing nucleoside triphosphate hydrolase protein, partial [Boeremia exigua]|uniref:P-loop containing nucleoside triphosphate hydrolase protein n=1 Tax=Boeremia exigua TaxID=749465 RepID=UPI001E8CBE76